MWSTSNWFTRSRFFFIPTWSKTSQNNFCECRFPATILHIISDIEFNYITRGLLCLSKQCVGYLESYEGCYQWVKIYPWIFTRNRSRICFFPPKLNWKHWSPSVSSKMFENQRVIKLYCKRFRELWPLKLIFLINPWAFICSRGKAYVKFLSFNKCMKKN